MKHTSSKYTSLNNYLAKQEQEEVQTFRQIIGIALLVIAIATSLYLVLGCTRLATSRKVA